jgi:hypothetical protein
VATIRTRYNDRTPAEYLDWLGLLGSDLLAAHCIASPWRENLGHVQELHVRPTLEVVLTETPAHLRRRPRQDLGGIALIDLDAG